MIKFIIYCTKAIVIALIALLFSSCGNGMNFNGGINGTGNVQTEVRAIAASFTKIEVSRGIEVLVEQGSDVLVEVEADSNLLQHITTKVVNGTLIITSDENINTAESEKVHVQMPTIEGLDATSGAIITSVSVLKGTAIALSTTSGSEINANLEYDAITAECTSGSTITLSGKALKLDTQSSSGSQFEADKLLVNEVTSEATSGSSTSVNVLVNLVAKVSSGASIDYAGTPKNVSKEESSGGSISGN